MTCWHPAIAQSLTLTGWSKYYSSSRLHCPDPSEWQLRQVPIDSKQYACMQAGAHLTHPTAQAALLSKLAQQLIVFPFCTTLLLTFLTHMCDPTHPCSTF